MYTAYLHFSRRAQWMARGAIGFTHHPRSVYVYDMHMRPQHQAYWSLHCYPVIRIGELSEIKTRSVFSALSCHVSFIYSKTMSTCWVFFPVYLIQYCTPVGWKCDTSIAPQILPSDRGRWSAPPCAKTQHQQFQPTSETSNVYGKILGE